MSPGAPANPFSTRHHVAGTLEPILPGGLDVPALFDRFLSHGRRGEVLGPHGSGKSTLLAHLAREAERRGLRVLTARAERHAARARLDEGALARGADLLCLDGADELSRWRWFFLRAGCDRRGVGLLVVTHRPLGLPTLHRAAMDDALARAVAARVLARSPHLPRLVSEDEAPEALRRCGGNLRSALLLMYDWYEERWAARSRPKSVRSP